MGKRLEGFGDVGIVDETNSFGLDFQLLFRVVRLTLIFIAEAKASFSVNMDLFSSQVSCHFPPFVSYKREFDYITKRSFRRRRVKALTKKLLLDDDVPVTLVESLVTRFSQTESNERQFVQNLVEFISEIKEPMIGEEIPTNAEEARKGETEVASYYNESCFWRIF